MLPKFIKPLTYASYRNFTPPQRVTAYSRFMNYTPETGFLYSSRIITDSIARNPVSLCYTYMEYAVTHSDRLLLLNFVVA